MNNKKRFTLALKNSLRFLPDRAYVSLYYWAKFQGLPDINNPKTFNEKLQRYKLYYKNPQLPSLVDKYCVREYVSDIIGEDYLTQLYGVYESAEDFLNADLPESFVAKCTHDSQSTHVCVDVSTFDISGAAHDLKIALKRNWYWQGREWAYKQCKPRIVVEEYLKEPGRNTPNDYKFYCFDGKVKMIQTDTDRFESCHSQQYFAPDWTSFGDWDYYDIPAEDLVKEPVDLRHMIELSEKLAEEFPHVRVDWYYIEGKLYFGELTFYTGGGFDPFHAKEKKLEDKLDKYLGDCFNLPEGV